MKVKLMILGLALVALTATVSAQSTVAQLQNQVEVTEDGCSDKCKGDAKKGSKDKSGKGTKQGGGSCQK